MQPADDVSAAACAFDIFVRRSGSDRRHKYDNKFSITFPLVPVQWVCRQTALLQLLSFSLGLPAWHDTYTTLAIHFSFPSGACGTDRPAK